MKKIIITLLLVFTFMLTACSSNKKDARDIEYFKTAFENEGYTLEKMDVPLFQMINASDGVLFYIDTSVVKIYQYKDEATYKKATEDYDFLQKMPKNGLFVAESSNEDLLEFFKTIE